MKILTYADLDADEQQRVWDACVESQTEPTLEALDALIQEDAERRALEWQGFPPRRGLPLHWY